MDNLIENLKFFGFNSYESKVYLALLKKYPATGYEISQLANIPQARAYDALKALEAEGFVSAEGGDKPLKYLPLSPKELTKRFKRKMSSSIDYLEKKLPDIKDDYNVPINNISGYKDTLTKIKEIINNTKFSLYLEIWASDYKQIEKEISDAYDRGVNIKIVGYDGVKSMYGLLYNHFGAAEVEEDVGARLIYLLSDNEEAILGRIENRVIWTKNMDIVYLLREFIAHDMYLLDIQEKFPEQLKYFYGAGFKKIKDKIYDKKSQSRIYK